MTDKIDLNKLSREEVLEKIKSKEIDSCRYNTFQEYQKRRQQN